MEKELLNNQTGGIGLSLAEKIKEVYEADLREKAEKIVNLEVDKFKSKLVEESERIIGRILGEILVHQSKDPVNLNTLLTVQLAKIKI